VTGHDRHEERNTVRTATPRDDGTITRRRWATVLGPAFVGASAIGLGLVAFAPVAGGQSAGSGASEAPDVGAPAPPAIAVEPSIDLVDGQVVTVMGSGLPSTEPGEAPGGVTIAQCRANPTTFDDCDRSSSLGEAAGGQGSLSAPFTVHRLLTTASGEVDCGVGPGCVIVLLDGAAGPTDPEVTVSAPIRFQVRAAGSITAAPSITG